MKYFRAFAIIVAFSFLLPSNLFAQELKPHPPAKTYGETHRFVFFAVLEGCFNDGLTQEEIDLIIPLRPEKEGFRNITTNMVLTCPLCSPAFDAFRLYADRLMFISGITKKEGYNTFGQGLPEAVRIELAKPGLPCRDAIQGLLRKWIEERIERSSLTEIETKSLRKELEQMRKDGEAALLRFQNGEHGDELQEHYKDWKGCPVCSGASPMGG
ncbi:MAG: hypothetical protein AAGA58_19845 [Verrucomicrobiota bacterium]